MPSAADILSQKKKEYAKLAIPLTVSKGQALRVFEKKSPHLRYASGSIFFQKTLTAAAALLFNLHIFFSFIFFFSFFGGGENNCCFCVLRLAGFVRLKKQVSAIKSNRRQKTKRCI